MILGVVYNYRLILLNDCYQEQDPFFRISKSPPDRITMKVLFQFRAVFVALTPQEELCV